ncbi:YaaL family protein [Bhargavaea cecembensis]|uniref:YaaL family protein n=1 Tax=Bhargavaea cecembensis TaxID=394098 RepID=UPI00058F74CD|nr:YaaL family protein [Bhargavaea cecembensis]
MFRRKNKLKREYDERLIRLLAETREEWMQAKELERQAERFDDDGVAKVRRQIAESRHLYLFKEARERNVQMK